MGSLFSSLGIAGGSLDILQQAIGVIQNNVTNATTPGYVTQTQELASRAFNPSEAEFGGVETTGVQSARDVYAEQSVWSASQQSGLSAQQSASLNSLQQIFDVTGTTGIPGALSSLYSAFSAWSANPTDATARQSVLAAAQGVATSFTQTASQAQQISANNDTQLTAAVSQLNQDSAQVASINGQIRSSAGGPKDAGLQAQLYTTLQDMSTLAPVGVHIESDGTATVLLGGQAPLVMGTTQNNVVANLNYSSTPPPTVAVPNPPTTVSVQLSVAGQDVTSLVNQGTLGGTLGFANTTMAAILGNGPQQGSLNQLAQSVADTVNGLLTSGDITAAVPQPPAVAVTPEVKGVPLFTYTAGTTGTTVASTLAVAITAGSQLAAITPTVVAVPALPVSANNPVAVPAVAAVAFSANGVAAQLAALASSTGTNGFTLTQTYGNIATDLGQQTATATANATEDTSLLNQATTLRASVSGVSLNDQATQLLQFQESYQASAQMVTTISTLAQDLLTASASWVSSSG